jgi:hypothetical protein
MRRRLSQLPKQLTPLKQHILVVKMSQLPRSVGAGVPERL